MILKIGTRKLDLYNDVAISLQYDSVASSYQFRFYFDPENADHKAMFTPGSYAPVTIEHNGELLITGVLLEQTFKSGPVRELMSVSGYSKTGVLQDCEIPTSAYPLQANGLSLKQIAEKAIKPFGLKLLVDASVSKEAASVFNKSTCDDKQSVRSYLCELANQKHIIVSHDEKGNLLLTKEQTTQAPVYDFTTGVPWVKMSLTFAGQNMHSQISLLKQASKSGKGNAGQAVISNPYVTGFRPTTKRQTSGRDVDTSLGVRNVLSKELKELVLTIELDRWVLNGKVIRPNTIVTAVCPDLHIYTKTRFFVATVDLMGDNVNQTAKLTCYVPEVYNSDTPKNIFK